MKELKLKVDGMMCEGCENRVKIAIMSLTGVSEVLADHKTGEVIVTTNADNEGEIREAIEDIGYEVVEE